jgi:hypothetical protein
VQAANGQPGNGKPSSTPHTSYPPNDTTSAGTGAGHTTHPPQRVIHFVSGPSSVGATSLLTGPTGGNPAALRPVPPVSGDNGGVDMMPWETALVLVGSGGLLLLARRRSRQRNR